MKFKIGDNVEHTGNNKEWYFFTVKDISFDVNGEEKILLAGRWYFSSDYKLVETKEETMEDEIKVGSEVKFKKELNIYTEAWFTVRSLSKYGKVQLQYGAIGHHLEGSFDLSTIETYKAPDMSSEGQLDRLQDEYDDLEAKVERLAKTLKVKEGAIKDYRAEISALKHKKEDRENTIEYLREKVEKLVAHLHGEIKMRDDDTTLQDILVSREVDHMKVVAELEDIRKRHEHVLNVNETLRNDRAALQLDRKDWESSTNILQETLKLERAKYKALMTEIKNMRSNIVYSLNVVADRDQ